MFPPLLLLSFLLVLVTCSAAPAPLPLITFGTGVSQGQLFDVEQTIFQHRLAPDSVSGVITHWWIGGPSFLANAIWSFYLDDETTPSLVFVTEHACGIGFNDKTAPWGNHMFGLTSQPNTGYYNNLRIPFYTSVKVTLRLPPNTPSCEFWAIVRGTENLPIVHAGVTLPINARLVLQKIENKPFQPLDFVDIISQPTGSGMVALTVLIASSGTQNFLEGCYHLISPYSDQLIPGMIVATGTEDYFASSFYFSSGIFHTDVSGYTHHVLTSNSYEMSAYRLHDSDVLAFNHGMTLRWRIGDTTNPKTGLKCDWKPNEQTVGSPTNTTVTSYAYFYLW